jgi:hypothetical protein
MGEDVRIRASAREQILWDMHVVLDSVAHEQNAREEFVREILCRFGVPEARTHEHLPRVCAALPSDPHEIDMGEALDVFERVLPIKWEDDLLEVAPQTQRRLKETFVQILVTARRPAFPQDVASHFLRATQDALGPDAIPEAVVPRLREVIESELLNGMWKSQDAASRSVLVDRILYYFRTVASLDLK